MEFKNRPEWARKLSRATWDGLKLCQDVPEPTLETLLDDVKYQRTLRDRGVVCWTCEDAIRELGIEL